jgi:hypothetical protein
MATHILLAGGVWQLGTTDEKTISAMLLKGFERISGILPGFTYFRIPKKSIVFRRESRRKEEYTLVSRPRWPEIRLNRW